MQRNIGDMLVDAGKITSSQLDEALKCQVIFGGRIGTNLIELGYLDEVELSAILSEKLRVPAADPNKLMNIPSDLIGLIPRDIVEKFKVIPYSVDKKRLNLVMVDPLNLAAIDEIAFRTGFIILPMVAPEVRIFTALEKYYEIRREMRYINVSQTITRQLTEKKEAPKAGRVAETKHEKPSAEKPAKQQPPSEPADLDFSSLFEGFDAIPGSQDMESFNAPVTRETQPAPVTVAPAAAPAASPPAAVPETAQAQAIVQPPPAPVPVDAISPEPIAIPVEESPLSLDDLSLSQAESRDREEIAEVLMKYLGQQFTRAALFRVRGNAATGWRATVKGRAMDEFEELQIDFTQPSTLKLVAEGKSFYLGPLPATVNNRLMLAAMGSGTLPTALLVPLLMMGRVVAVLYIDGDQATLGERLPELQKIVAKVALAFEILILRTKILAG